MHFRNTHSHPTVVEAVVEENTTCVGVEIFVTSWCWLAMEGCRLRAPWMVLPLWKAFTTSICKESEIVTACSARERENKRKDHPIYNTQKVKKKRHFLKTEQINRQELHLKLKKTEDPEGLHIHPYPLLTVSVTPVRTATLVKNGEISLITPIASYLLQDHTWVCILFRPLNHKIWPRRNSLSAWSISSTSSASSSSGISSFCVPWPASLRNFSRLVGIVEIN